jgi:hypothetical protein
VAVAGTEVTIDVLLQELIVAVAPLNLTKLPPCVVPKPVPVIVTMLPVFPELGLMAVTLNPEETVKLNALLAIPLAVRITLPVVAPEGTAAMISPSLQFVAVAAVPLNLRVLVPWLDPKPAPVIVTVAPIPPAVGERLVTPGPGFTVNVIPELASPDAVTTTLPEVAPEGT